LLGDLVVPYLLDQWRWGYTLQASRNRESIACFLSGALAAQLAVLALWAAIGQTRFTIRFLGALFLSVVIAIVFLIGLRIAFTAPPIFVVFLTLGTAFFGVLISTLIFTLTSLWTKERLQHRSDSKGTSAQPAGGKFSIAYLIGLTTGTALLVAMLKTLVGSFSDQSFGGPAVPTIIDICLVTTQYVILCTLIVLCVTQLVLRTQGNAVAALGLLAIVFIATPVHFALLATYRTLRLQNADYFYAGIYLFGFTFFCLLFAAIGRLAGYRLVSNSREHVTVA
jgi:hypothetical protein